MASADQYVSAEVLAQVSGESFAQNLSNYRSLLLQWEREIEAGGTDDTRARMLFREAAMLQEIVQDQMRGRGRDLGVPPEAVQEVSKIYQRALAKLLFRVAADSHLTAPAVSRLIEQVEAATSPPADLVTMVQKVKLARTAYESVLLTPSAASLVAPSLVKLLEDIGGIARYFESQLPPIVLPPPPVGPPSSSGGGDDGDLPRRVDRLEQKMDKVTGDLSSISTTLARMEEFLKHSAMKADVSRVEERLTHMPTKAQMYIAGGAALAAVLGVMAKGFGWL